MMTDGIGTPTAWQIQSEKGQNSGCKLLAQG